MSFAEKIDEWIKEVETRPGSALMILKLVAGRLRDLTERNEELLSENIALQDGSKVEDYQKRIAHLEFQLDLLKRQLGSLDTRINETPVESESWCLLAYNAMGRILRLQIPNEGANQLKSLGKLTGELVVGSEIPRLVALRSNEEILLLFSSGRVSTRAVREIQTVETGGNWDWEQAALPDEPHAGELLVSLLPLSRLPVSDYILQISRRGVVKKTLCSLAEKILSSHYLGRGAFQKSDQPLDVCLIGKKTLIVAVTYEGRILKVNADDLSYAAEERIRLNPLDHIIAGFVMEELDTVLCITQTGKVIERESVSIEIAKSGLARGQALIPPSRLEQGTRFIGAMPFRKTDRIVILDADGNLNLINGEDASAAGSLHTEALCIASGRIPGLPKDK